MSPKRASNDPRVGDKRRPNSHLFYQDDNSAYFDSGSAATQSQEKMAEGVGFEPTVSVTPRSISSRVP